VIVQAKLLPSVRQPKARDSLSFSAVSTFQTCPLRYYFRYVLGLPEETIRSSVVFGAAIHAAIQLHFEQLLACFPAPDLDALLGAFWDSWHSHEGQTVLFGRSEDINTIGDLADRMLIAFQASDLARPQGTILGIEEELRGVLIPGCPDLLARVDLLVERDDALILFDSKTARRPWSPASVVEASGQLLLYSEVVKPLADGKPLSLAFAVLTKAKFPSVTLHPVDAHPKQVERTKRIVERVWRTIEAGNFYPNPSPANCLNCPFREPCRSWQG
jgi:hypothetical protein